MLGIEFGAVILSVALGASSGAIADSGPITEPSVSEGPCAEAQSGGARIFGSAIPSEENEIVWLPPRTRMTDLYWVSSYMNRVTIPDGTIGYTHTVSLTVVPC